MNQKHTKKTKGPQSNLPNKSANESDIPQNYSLKTLDPKIESTDFYFNDAGLMVFTREYHLKRGYCCNSGCKHCPY